MNIFVSLVFINLFSLFCYGEEFFFQFDVGQGNCQLIVYEDNGEKIGVMYDIGTSASQKHFKYIQEKPTTLNILEEKNLSIAASTAVGSSKSLVSGFLASKGKIPPPIWEEGESGSDHSSMTDDSKTSQKAQKKIFITDTLINLNFNHLYIFLSHTDADHINLLIAVPAEIKKTVILCGDWLGKTAASTTGDNLSRDVQGVLSILANDENCDFFIPYYLNYNDTFIINQETSSEEWVGHEGIIGCIRKTKASGNVCKELFEYFGASHFGCPCHTPLEFHGSLINLLNWREKVKNTISIQSCSLDKAQDPALSETVTSTAKSREREGQELSQTARPQPKPSAEKNVLKNIFIWIMNTVSEDKNNHCPIVSCTFPEKEMSFVFTGDAHNSVFQRIHAYLEERKLSTRDVIRNMYPKKGTIFDKNHIIWLSIPHHGSKDNEVPQAWPLFEPNGFIIPAGSSHQYDHPSLVLVNSLMRTPSMKDRYSEFNQRFSTIEGVDYSFLAFLEDAKPYCVKGLQQDKNPILCPNIMGSISMKTERNIIFITSHGFFPIIDIVKDGKEISFEINYKKRVDDAALLNDDKVFEPWQDSIWRYTNSKRENSFFWAVMDYKLKKLLFYPATKLEEVEPADVQTQGS